MRPKLHPLHSGSVSQVIYTISNGNNYLQAISNKLNKTPGSISQQLITLETHNYINYPKNKTEKLNKKIIALNYPIILKDIIHEINERYMDSNKVRSISRMSKTFANQKELYTDPKIQQFIKSIFIVLSNGKHELSFIKALNALIKSKTFSQMPLTGLPQPLNKFIRILQEIEEDFFIDYDLSDDILKAYKSLN